MSNALALLAAAAFAGLWIFESRRRAQFERQSQEKKRLFDATLHSIGDAVIVTDLEERVVDMNPLAENLTGYSLAEALGRHFDDIFVLREEGTLNPGDRPLHRAILNRGPSTMARGMALLQKGGAEIPVTDSASPVIDSTGKMHGGVIVFRDRRQDRAMEERFRKLLDSTPDAVIIALPSGAIWHVNDQAAVVFGYTKEELQRITIEDLVPQRMRLGHAAHRQLYAAAPRVRPMGGTQALSAVRKDGSEFPVAISLSPFFDGETKLTIASIRDITQERKAAESLRRAKESSELANKELEAFSYSVAHDLRAPLRSIDGFSEALAEELGEKLSGDAKDYLSRVRASAKHMSGLIDDLLALSRVTRIGLTREQVSASTLVEEALERLRERYPTRHVEVMVEPNVVVEADPKLLAIAIENLVGNAWKFTSKRADARITFQTKIERGQRIFCISDNGAGFDPAHASRLFSPFQRLHRSDEYEGTGIGLAIVHRVITRHGGSIWAEAKPGEGAIFSFSLGNSDAV